MTIREQRFFETAISFFIGDWSTTKLKREIAKYLRKEYGEGDLQFSITLTDVYGNFIWNGSSIKEILEWGKENHEPWYSTVRYGAYIKHYVLEYSYDCPRHRPGNRDCNEILHYGSTRREAMEFYYMKNIYGKN